MNNSTHRSVLFPACSHSVLPKRLSIYLQSPRQQTAAPAAGNGKSNVQNWCRNNQHCNRFIFIFCFQVIVIQIMVAIVQQVKYFYFTCCTQRFLKKEMSKGLFGKLVFHTFSDSQWIEPIFQRSKRSFSVSDLQSLTVDSLRATIDSFPVNFSPFFSLC